MTKFRGLISIAAFSLALFFFSGCNHTGSSTSGSPSDFEGVVSYGVSNSSNLPAEVDSVFSKMVLKTYVKGTKTRTEQAMAGNRSVVMADSKDPDSPIILIDMFGGKYAVKQNDSLKKLAEQNVPKIEYVDSSGTGKQIAGYNCKKARCTINMANSGPVTSVVYYTEDLPYADPKGSFKGLKGMPMEFSMNIGNFNIVISAETVDKQKLPDSLFTIPADYKLMSLNEIQAAMMEQMSKSRDTNSANGTK